MSDVSIAWGVAALIAAAALALLMRVSTEGKRTQQKDEELEELRKESRNLRKQVEQRSKALRKNEAELERLSRQAGKAQKSSASAKVDARDERSKLRERNDALEEAVRLNEDALAAAGREVEALRVELERKASRLATVEALAQSTPPEPAPVAVDPALVEELTERATEAEARLRAHDDELGAARADAERLKARLEKQDLLYVSIRSELEIKKERLRQQRAEIERLQAFKVAVVDAPEDAGQPPAEIAGTPSDAPAPSAPGPDLGPRPVEPGQ